MPLKEHLVEARNRLFKSALAMLPGVVIGWIIYDPLMAALTQPLRDISRERGIVASLNFSGVTTSFDLKLQIALILGLVIASPVWIYQLWAFITPGLTKKERRYTLSYMAASVPLFLAGIYAGWLIWPNIVRAMTSFTPQGGSNILDSLDYLRFALQLMLFMGVAFLVPVLLFALNAIGLVRGATYLKAWRFTILGVTIVSAMAAPGSDVMSMFFLAIPLLVLYFGAIGLCMLNDKRRDRRNAKIAAETEATADTAKPLAELD
ncbi:MULTISPECIES: twin-arginine translocase subunit TatC [unclassified Arthrobacter]|uniref:twin-arginine translocase subunit TatC n=1 Tax=unclassified Arthrobacter TaxID=235627 RepID=UPI00159D2CE7|nr:MULTISPECIES: twin-arginine translocase subunit TatC [unclassified Arthrobacter]MCQ9165799.1 twin-arginine translocase subunit TatC [Arthrobacter sp. STN4]NVM98016.1 twin-arginine translocase subunit TatC [Arthrobacter sp. SDTb3-6]